MKQVWNDYTQKFELVKEGGEGSGRYPAGSSSNSDSASGNTRDVLEKANSLLSSKITGDFISSVPAVRDELFSITKSTASDVVKHHPSKAGDALSRYIMYDNASSLATAHTQIKLALKKL